MAFYHATLRENLSSIQEFGLGGKRAEHPNFQDCEPGVYLTNHPLLAIGFLIEAAMEPEFQSRFPSPREAFAQFAVIVIDSSLIDTKKLKPDPQIEKPGFWKYEGIIPIAACPILDPLNLTP